MRRIRLYRRGTLEREVADGERVGDLLTEDGTVAWLHLEEPEPADVTALVDELGVSPLAAAEFARTSQRVKVTRHENYLLLTVFETWVEPRSVDLRTSEIGLIVAERWLVTWCRAGEHEPEWLTTADDGEAHLATHGVDFLVHRLLEGVVDSHFAAVEQLDDVVDAIEAELFAGERRGTETQMRSFAVRKALVGLRRVALPMREVLLAFTRRDVHPVDEAMVPYFADVYEQVLRVAEWTETLRDVVTTIQDSMLQIQNNRINEVMRRLSAWAAIFAASTAITGFYGMNVLYPQVGTRVGAVTASVLLVASTIGLVVFFRARRWL